MNTHFTVDEVTYVIGDSDANAVFIDASMNERGKQILEVKTASSSTLVSVRRCQDGGHTKMP